MAEAGNDDRFRAFAESAQDGILVLDADLQVEYANPAMLNRLGLARLATRDVLAHRLPPDEVDRFRSDVAQVLAHDEPVHVERPVALSQSDSVWMSIRLAPVSGFSSRPSVLAVLRDIDDRKRDEQAFRESLRRYRTLIDNMPLAVYLKNRESVFVSVNEEFAKEVNRSPAQIPGKTDFDLVSPAFAQKVRADDARIMASGVMEEFDQEHFRNGQARILRTTKVPVRDERGNVTGILGMFSDVTEHRHLEESLARQTQFAQAILAAIPGALFLTDEEGHPLHWNRQLEEITGCEPDEIACKRLLDFYDGANHVRIANALGETLAGDRVVLEAEITNRHGGRVPLYITMAHVEIGGKPGFLGVAFDITANRRTEEALRQKEAELKDEQQLAYWRLQSLSRRLLEIQETERRNLARELHDELGQALTAAKITLQTLERYPDPDALAARLADARSIVERALDQVRSLSLGLRPPLLDDLGLPAALRWLLDQHGRRSGLRVQFQDETMAARPDPPVETACFRIAQEALTNATKHAAASCVSVELRHIDDVLHLHVHDDGLGFDVAAARARATGGTSLGLMGMEERATLAGGHIEWKSGAGLGTDVHAWFPIGHRL